jgi:hypothetical protein
LGGGVKEGGEGKGGVQGHGWCATMLGCSESKKQTVCMAGWLE